MTNKQTCKCGYDGDFILLSSETWNVQCPACNYMQPRIKNASNTLAWTDEEIEALIKKVRSL